MESESRLMVIGSSGDGVIGMEGAGVGVGMAIDMHWASLLKK